MPTTVMLQDQLAELRMLIDRNDPAHLEAETAFTAMVAKIMREAEMAESISKLDAEQMTGSMVKCMMRGTAEAYDALAQDTFQQENGRQDGSTRIEVGIGRDSRLRRYRKHE